MSRRSTILYAATNVVAFLRTVAATTNTSACFTPNGTDINEHYGYSDGEIYAPCNTSASFSMCCAIGPNRTSPDTCFADGSGLCYNDNVGTDVDYWRESCTDPTWEDPACVKLFTNDTSLGYWGDTPMIKCNDGTFCDLAVGNTIAQECCAGGDGIGYEIISGTVTIQSTTSTTAPSSSTSTSPATTTAAATPPSSTTTSASPSPKAGLDTGAKAGIGVGVALGVIALLILGGLFILRSRRKRRQNAARGGVQQLSEMSHDGQIYEAPPMQYASELEGDHGVGGGGGMKK